MSAIVVIIQFSILKCQASAVAGERPVDALEDDHSSGKLVVSHGPSTPIPASFDCRIATTFQKFRSMLCCVYARKEDRFEHIAVNL